MKQNLVTLKIRYACEDSLRKVLEQYNNVLRFTYNRLLENPKMSTAEIGSVQKTLNNCEIIGSHLRNSAIFDAKAMIERSTKPIIFGGKHLFRQRSQQKISREEFLLRRLRPLNCVGEANQKGNRLFKIIDDTTIQFNFNRHTRYTLKLRDVGRKRQKELSRLSDIQNARQIPITYKLDTEYVYLTFDYNAIKTYSYQVKQDRVFAIDMNPNSVGWSVVDWVTESEYQVIQAGTFSLKPLNDYRDSLSVASDSRLHKYVTDKRRHEIIELAKRIFRLCKH